MFETDREPDFVNELGVKWWLNNNLTTYASQPDHRGTVLSDVLVYIVEFPEGRKTFVLVRNGNVIFDDPSLETVGSRIDTLKVMQRYDNGK